MTDEAREAARSVSPLAVDAVARVLCRWHEGEPGDVQFPCDACKGAAGAVVAEFGPLTANREALAAALWDLEPAGTADKTGTPRTTWAEIRAGRAANPDPDYPHLYDDLLAKADALLASGVVVDRAEVEREALERAAKIADDYAREALDQRERSDYPESWIGMQYHGQYHGAQDVAIRIRLEGGAR